MKELGAVISQVIVMEYGTAELLRRLSDPVWFQTFGSVLGFDWHSSGLTTVVCGALKEGLAERQGELGLFVAGGKGRASRRTPEEIAAYGERYALPNDLQQLQRTSRLVAKVDSAAVQDGYQLYHHVFVFDAEGRWAVVQQGMNDASGYARRYHWLSESAVSLTRDPHAGVCGRPEAGVLNLVASGSEATRLASVELCRERPDAALALLQRLREHGASAPGGAAAARAGGLRGGGWPRLAESELPRPDMPQQLAWFDDLAAGGSSLAAPGAEQAAANADRDAADAVPHLILPSPHPIPASGYLDRMLYRLYDKPPADYEALLDTAGVGPGTLRALAMVAEVTHGARPAYEDPVRYTFAHGGKDGFPFPASRRDLEHSIGVLQTAVEKAKIGESDRLQALRKLAQLQEG
jgi:hypothetical protein